MLQKRTDSIFDEICALQCLALDKVKSKTDKTDTANTSLLKLFLLTALREIQADSKLQYRCLMVSYFLTLSYSF